MPRPPAIPSNVTQAEFGQNVMRWGAGDAAARSRLATLTKTELEDAGVTLSMATAWRDFYLEEQTLRPKNPSAKGRAELMQHAVKLLEETA